MKASSFSYSYKTIASLVLVFVVIGCLISPSSGGLTPASITKHGSESQSSQNVRQMKLIQPQRIGQELSRQVPIASRKRRPSGTRRMEKGGGETDWRNEARTIMNTLDRVLDFFGMSSVTLVPGLRSLMSMNSNGTAMEFVPLGRFLWTRLFGDGTASSILKM